MSFLAAAGVLLAFAAWRDAGAEYWLDTGPDTAPWPLQSDPRIALASRNTALLAHEDQDEAFWRAVPAESRAALLENPLDPVAVRQLGLAENALGEEDSSTYFALAERISRRDTPTQISFLRLAVADNDYARSFMHLDTILTTEPGAGRQFFPPMAVLLADPEVRRVLAPYGGRWWFGPFATTAVKETENPADLVAVLLASPAPLPPDVSGALLPRLLDRLADAGNYAAARQLAIGLGKASSEALDDFAMTTRTTDPRFAPLTWRLSETDAVQTSLTREGLDVQLRPGIATLVAERITALPAGGHLLHLETERGAGDGALIVAWDLRCREGDWKRVAWHQPLPMDETNRRYQSRFEVPGDCPLQRWRLTALADETQSDMSFRIAKLRISAP